MNDSSYVKVLIQEKKDSVVLPKNRISALAKLFCSKNRKFIHILGLNKYSFFEYKG